MEEQVNDSKNINPYGNSNIFSKTTYRWTNKAFQTGKKREIEFSDLYKVLHEHSSATLGEKFGTVWNDTKIKNSPSIIKTIWQCYKKQICINFFATFILECVIRIAQPIFLGKLVSLYISEQKDTREKMIYIHACGVVFCSVIYVCIAQTCAMSIVHLCMKYRVGCSSIIYRKALKLSKTALGQTTVGHIVNLVSNDVGRFDIATVLMNYIIIAPLQVIILTFFMYWEIGPSGIIGMIVLVLFIPLQIWLGKQAKSVRTKVTSLTDIRLKLLNEILVGISSIKMYAWEKPFSKSLKTARKNEINKLKKVSYIRTIVMSFGMFNTRFAMFCSIVVYVLVGNEISAEKVFVLAAFYGILKHSLSVLFPQAITMISDLSVTSKRLKSFLLLDELNYTPLSELDVEMSPVNMIADDITEEIKRPFLSINTYKQDIDKGAIHNESYETDTNNSSLVTLRSEETFSRKHNISYNDVILKKVSAKWIPSQNYLTLNKISLNINHGSLVAVIGSVGAGKSSLFYTILKELPISHGMMQINGKLSYASQEPWTFNSTIMQNILFGDKMDKFRYRDVIKRCALEHDISTLLCGDATIIGERGMTLSGGQKARINLARAVYKKADIYLFDDPFSSVDVHIGKHLFNDCIIDYLSGKTRLIIMNQPQYLNQVDYIFMLREGTLIAEGKFDHLKDTNREFNDWIESQMKMTEKTFEEKIEQDKNSINSQPINKTSKNKYQEISEERHKGSVGKHIYKSYVSSCGPFTLFITITFLFLFTQFLASGSDFWISYWVNVNDISNSKLRKHILDLNNKTLNDENIISTTTTYNSSTFTCYDADFKPKDQMYHNFYIYVYTVFIIALIFTTISRSAVFFWSALKGSLNLHNKMFKSVLFAVMHFFYRNPSGRILNRFSRDVNATDEVLPNIMFDVIQIFLQLLGIVIVVIIVNPWLILPVIIMFGIFSYLRIYYLSTSRSLKRLEAIARSPIFTHLSSSIQGITTIRALEAQQTMINQFDMHQDLHSSVWFMILGTGRAFGLWLDGICVFFIAIVTFSFVLLEKHSLAGNVGLAISQALALMGMIQWGIRQSTEMENFMTSVERILEYHEIEQEPIFESIEDKRIPKNWPASGHILFENVSLAYYPNDNPVIHDLYFEVKSCEKIGIVGRTGSGKSSIIKAILRMAFVNGTIKIDGIDHKSVELHRLRSSISIIPQEPILFSGNIRRNIDPFDKYSDSIIWSALEQVQMKYHISNLPKGLDFSVTEGGSNFSVGQRQLLCLARAIIRNNRILILDEATANVDPQIDKLIQNTIRENFSHCTILTIAHRLQTVIDSDKVLVMDSGKMIEFDHPYLLLQEEDGAFLNLVKSTKEEMYEKLVSVAEKNYITKHGILP